MRFSKSTLVVYLILLRAAFAAEPNEEDSPKLDDFERPYQIIADFNNDGLPDIAISDAAFWGNAGGGWTIYLRQKSGSYRRVGDVFFHGLAFAVRPIKPGVGKLIVYIRGGVLNGSLVEYSVS